MKNVVTHAGTRRSEKKYQSPHVGKSPAEIARIQEEDPRFPGFHTIAVSKINPMGSGYASPLGTYKGMGYKVMEDDKEKNALLTGHEDLILLGVPIEEHLEREREREEFHNGLLTNLIDEAMEDMPEYQGQKGTGVYFDRNRSGVADGEEVDPEAPRRGRPRSKDAEQ